MTDDGRIFLDIPIEQPPRSRLLDHVLQALLLVTSAAAIWLVAQTPPLQAWGYVVGLASQPFWLAATWRARQWGMFLLAFFYIGAWTTGIVNHFR